jgi:hypothetical protein
MLGLAILLSLLLIRATQVATGEPPAEWAERIIHVMGLLPGPRIRLKGCLTDPARWGPGLLKR